MNNIRRINEDVINEIFDRYKDELPVERLNMAKQMVLERAKWMIQFYYANKKESRGKII